MNQASHKDPDDDLSGKPDAEELEIFDQHTKDGGSNLDQAHVDSSTTSRDEPEFDDGISLEELSRSYAEVIGNQSKATESETDIEIFEAEQAENSNDDESNDLSDTLVNPMLIIEAILFVGRPDNSAIAATEIAQLMRGVNEAEVVELIAELNRIYDESDHAMRIVEAPDGYRTILATQLEFIRERFYGRARDASLNQSAIDCLALIAYQPGISRQEVENQRGQPSGGILNQLVRRRLIKMQRESTTAEGEDKLAPHYYPTEKLVELAGLTSLDDLPQVEELELD